VKPRRMFNAKTGRKGWQFRFSDPVSGRRIKKTFWIPERREADRAYQTLIGKAESRENGVPDAEGWKLSYEELVRHFIEGAEIESEQRRARLKFDLERNPLGLRVGSDLRRKVKLKTACRRLTEEHGDVWVSRCVQAPLKQLTRWLASEVDLLDVDPLAAWRRVRRQSKPRERRAYKPEEIVSLLRAARDLDGLTGRAYPLEIVLKVLLFTGNRPSAVFGATADKVRNGRIELPEGRGCKRNGLAYLPTAFLPKLNTYLASRHAIGTEKPLLVSPLGKALDIRNVRADFTRAMYLSALRSVWPQDAGIVQPEEVAFYLQRKRVPGNDGKPPKDAAKLSAIRNRGMLIAELGERLRPAVMAALAGLDLYALRKTHVTWARQAGVIVDCVKAQVGHAAKDVEEKHYLDLRLIDAKASAEAVWQTLASTEAAAAGEQTLPLVVNAEGPDLQSVAPAVAPEGKRAGTAKAINPCAGIGSPAWTRTRNPVINSHVLYRLSYRGTTATENIRPPPSARRHC
jgi:integrase